MNLKFVFLFFFWCLMIGAQMPESVLESRYKSLRILVNKDLSKTKKDAERLIGDAFLEKNHKIEVKGNYILAFSYMLENDSEKSFAYANKALELAKKYNYIEGQALAYRILGTQYAKMNLLQVAMENFDKALGLIKDLRSEEGYEIAGLINSSKLVALGDGTDREKVIEKLKVSKEVVGNFRKISDKKLREHLLISAYTNVGYNFSDYKNIDSANFYFDKALQLVSKDDQYMLAAICHDKGYMYHKNKEFDKAVESFQKALGYLSGQDKAYASKKTEILKNLSEAYISAGNTEKYIETNEKYKNLVAETNTDYLKTLDHVIEIKNHDIQAENKKAYRFKIFAISLAFSFIMSIVLFVSYRGKNERKYMKLREMLAQSEGDGKHNKYQQLSPKSQCLNDSKESTGQEEISVSEKTTDRILAELFKFEEGKEFLNSSFTISHLALLLNTNTKTLSYIIKKYKNQNFNAYINHLRILYFIDRIEKDKEFRKYKLSYVAKALGYSSSTAFSNSFKAITGILPSVYLKNLNNEQDL